MRPAMTAITTGMARAATFVACSPRIQEALAEVGPPRLEFDRDMPTREGRSPRRRPGDSARPGRIRTTSGASPHSQDDARGDRVHRRSAAGPPPSATSGCTTHRASASTRPEAPIRLPRAPCRAVPPRAAGVREGCLGQSGQGLRRQRRRQRSSGSFADRLQTLKGWLQTRAGEGRARWQRTQQDRRRRLGTSRACQLSSSSSHVHRTCWPPLTVRAPERVDG